MNSTEARLKPLSPEAFRKLMDANSYAPLVQRGIMQRHLELGGRIPKAENGSDVLGDLAEMFGFGKHR